MPKISAPTVGEHRAAQESALVAAGEAILRADGLAAVTPRAVSERAGLARSSFYAYFPSRDDLLAAIAVGAIRAWNAELGAAIADVAPGIERLRALVRASLAMAGDARHRIAGALRDADLAPSKMDDLMVIHGELVRPLVEVLTELGAEEPYRLAILVQGALGSGMQLVEHGVPVADVDRQLTVMLERGILA